MVTALGAAVGVDPDFGGGYGWLDGGVSASNGSEQWALGYQELRRWHSTDTVEEALASVEEMADNEAS